MNILEYLPNELLEQVISLSGIQCWWNLNSRFNNVILNQSKVKILGNDIDKYDLSNVTVARFYGNLNYLDLSRIRAPCLKELGLYNYIIDDIDLLYKLCDKLKFKLLSKKKITKEFFILHRDIFLSCNIDGFTAMWNCEIRMTSNFHLFLGKRATKVTTLTVSTIYQAENLYFRKMKFKFDNSVICFDTDFRKSFDNKRLSLYSVQIKPLDFDKFTKLTKIKVKW